MDSVTTPSATRAQRIASHEGAERQLRVRCVRLRAEVEVCSAEGEVDLFTVPLLRDVLRDTEQRRVPRVFVDLSQVGFLAVAGVRVLNTAAQHARATHRQLGLIVATHPARRALTVTAADTLVTYECLSDALAALALPAQQDRVVQ